MGRRSRAGLPAAEHVQRVSLVAAAQLLKEEAGHVQFFFVVGRDGKDHAFHLLIGEHFHGVHNVADLGKFLLFLLRLLALVLRQPRGRGNGNHAGLVGVAAQKADEARALAQGELEDAREALADKETECDDLAQSVENALQHAEDMEAEARKLAAEVMRLKARLFDLMEARQGWTV